MKLKFSRLILPFSLLMLVLTASVNAQQAGNQVAYESACQQIADRVDREICQTNAGITYLENQISSSPSSTRRSELQRQLQAQRQKLTRLQNLIQQERQVFNERAQAAQEARSKQR